MKNTFMQIVTPGMAKVVICAVAILALSYVIFVRGEQEVEADRGGRATEGIELTSKQATDMTQTADAVSVLIEEVSDEVSPTPSADVVITPIVQKSQPAMKPDAWYVQRTERLVNSWGPRYAAAIDDIMRFEHRFRTAEARLEEYFQQQSEITESINDRSLRAELRNRDAEERAAYARWTEEGRELLSQAQRMRADLDDMDAVIRKQQLTVSMLSEYSRASSIPSSVKSLHASLSDFRRQSDELANDLSRQIFSN